MLVTVSALKNIKIFKTLFIDNKIFVKIKQINFIFETNYNNNIKYI